MSGVPKPGSKYARALGCTCPVMDNCHGKGRGGDGKQFGWFVSDLCGVHANASDPVWATCRNCGGAKQEWQVYCGAACCAEFEMKGKPR